MTCRWDLVRSEQIMISTTRAWYWVLALPLAVLVLIFCQFAAAFAATDGPMCGGLDSSERACAQSGVSTPILAVVHDQPLAQRPDLPCVAVSPAGALAKPPQHYADLATPRPPPRLT